MADNEDILLHLKIWVLQITSSASKRYKPTRNLAQFGSDKVYSITWVQGIYYGYISASASLKKGTFGDVLPRNNLK